MGHHFFNLLASTWSFVVAALGTTTLSIVLFSFALPVLVWFSMGIKEWLNKRRAGMSFKIAIRGTFLSWPTAIAAGLSVLAWICLLSWSFVKTVYNDHRNLAGRLGTVVNEKNKMKTVLENRDDYIKRLERANAELSKRPESCPKCETSGNTTRLDILCQNLADCPSAELTKRSSELIAKLRAIIEPYNADVQRWENALRAEQLRSPAYNDMETKREISLKGEAARVMGNYRYHHIDVLAMREALSRRLGQHEEHEELAYQFVGTTRGTPHMVEDIIFDLSKLTGEVRNLRQH